MDRYIKTDILAKIIFDKWKEFDELKQIIPDIQKAVMCESTFDLVPKERYANLLANSIIVCEALKKYQSADMVEVVRCKDCKYGEELKDVNGYRFRVCGNHNFVHGLSVEDHGFCKWGKRRDDEESTKGTD